MDLTTIVTIGTFVASAVLGLIAHVVRSQVQRIDDLEHSIMRKTDESEVRQIVADKVDPIKESMSEIKEKVDKVIDLLIRNK